MLQIAFQDRSRSSLNLFFFDRYGNRLAKNSYLQILVWPGNADLYKIRIRHPILSIFGHKMNKITNPAVALGGRVPRICRPAVSTAPDSEFQNMTQDSLCQPLVCY